MAEELLPKQFAPYVPKKGEEYMSSRQLAHFRTILETLKSELMHDIERTGGEGYFLPVPYFAESLEERDMFLGQRSVQDLLALARQSDVFVVGIGSIEPQFYALLREKAGLTDPEFDHQHDKSKWPSLKAKLAAREFFGFHSSRGKVRNDFVK